MVSSRKSNYGCFVTERYARGFKSRGQFLQAVVRNNPLVRRMGVTLTLDSGPLNTDVLHVVRTYRPGDT